MVDGSDGLVDSNRVDLLGYRHWLMYSIRSSYWHWVGHSYWLGNGSGYLDFLDLRLSVLDDGASMVGSFDVVRCVFLHWDFLGLDGDFSRVNLGLGQEG